MDIRRGQSVILLLLASMALSSCGSGLGTTTQSIVSQQRAEASLCSTGVVVTNPITVTSTAYFYYRATVVATGLTGSPVQGRIPYAEVVVTDASGATVACGNTDNLGQISIPIQKTPGTYTLRVNSRASNSKINVSILKDITTNEHYSITQTFTVVSGDGATKVVSPLYAYARLAESANL
ncbi:MAG: hypothetical protein V4736_01845, partial [Bdellovibrionota bacterium]